MNNVLLVVLTTLHIFCAVAWLGSFIYVILVMFPGMGKMKGEGRREFLATIMPRHEYFTLAFGTATIGFGLALGGLFYLSGNVSPTWENYMLPGIIAAGVAYVLMLVGMVSLGKMVKSGKLAMLASRPPVAMMLGMVLGLVLLIMSFVFMVMAATLG